MIISDHGHSHGGHGHSHGLGRDISISSTPQYIHVTETLLKLEFNNNHSMYTVHEQHHHGFQYFSCVPVLYYLQPGGTFS
jgi:hypothetical protein